MSDKTGLNVKRRRVVIYTLAGMLPIPIKALLVPTTALAADNRVTEDDAQAKALGYKNDANQSARPSKDQECANCLHYKGTSGDSGPCEIFPGKEVAAKGWCSAWVKKA